MQSGSLVLNKEWESIESDNFTVKFQNSKLLNNGSYKLFLYVSKNKTRTDSINDVVIIELSSNSSSLKFFKQSEIEIINRLSNPTGPYSHGVFGRFGDITGHYLWETIPKVSEMMKKHFDNDLHYGKIFTNEEDEKNPQFMARVLGEKLSNGFTFRLMFKDRKGDHRGGSHTDYILFVPESEISAIKPAIISNPDILIKVFQKVFPEYDRSNGTLRIDDSKPYFEKS
jgi:hypothetical protein